jgi:hypothetical protein
MLCHILLITQHVSITTVITLRVDLQEYQEHNKHPNSISGITQRFDRYVINYILYTCICSFCYTRLKILVLFGM